MLCPTPVDMAEENITSELPADVESDIKRQQEGKLPSASPAFESATKFGRQLDVGQTESIRTVCKSLGLLLEEPANRRSPSQPPHP